MMKTTSNIKQGIWKELMEVLDEWNIKALDTKNSKLNINRSDFTVTLQNGSEFVMKGIDNEEKAKGLSNFSDLYLDEANLFTQDDFIALNGSIRSRKYKNLQVIISFNPMSMSNWLYTYFGFDTGIVPPNTMVLKTTYKDNRFLPDTYHDEVLLPIKKTNPRLYNILAEGLFQTTDRLVYENWKVQTFDVNELQINNIDLKVCIGLDWGWMDATTVICSLVDEKTKTWYIVDEIYESRLVNSQIAQRIKEKGWHKNVIIADCANPKDIQDLKKMGVDRVQRCIKGKGSIMNGIRKLQEFNIIVNPKCKHTIIELDNYTWKKDKATGHYIDEPIDDFNHCLDSVRYSIQTISNKGKVTFMNKNLFGL